MWGLNPGSIARLLPLCGSVRPTTADGSRWLDPISESDLLTVVRNSREESTVVVVAARGRLCRVPRRSLMKVA